MDDSWAMFHIRLAEYLSSPLMLAHGSKAVSIRYDKVSDPTTRRSLELAYNRDTTPCKPASSTVC